MIECTESRVSIQKILMITNAVDDNEILHYWLRHHGYSVDVVTKVKLGITQAKKTHYRLILIDDAFNEEFGVFEVVWLLKTMIPDVNIVLITKEMDDSERSKMLSHGINNWITKPVSYKKTPKQLLKIIQNTNNKTDWHPVSWKQITKLMEKLKSISLN